MTIARPNGDAILSLRPGASWIMHNDDLATLAWLDLVQVRPTDTEISAEAARINSIGPVPSVISRRQFFQQLAVLSIISQADALNAIKSGVIPTPLQNLLNALPSDKQFDAAMLIIGEPNFNRNNWLTPVIGSAYGWNVSQIDQFFQAASAL